MAWPPFIWLMLLGTAAITVLHHYRRVELENRPRRDYSKQKSKSNFSKHNRSSESLRNRRFRGSYGEAPIYESPEESEEEEEEDNIEEEVIPYNSQRDLGTRSRSSSSFHSKKPQSNETIPPIAPSSSKTKSSPSVDLNPSSPLIPLDEVAPNPRFIFNRELPSQAIKTTVPFSDPSSSSTPVIIPLISPLSSNTSNKFSQKVVECNQMVEEATSMDIDRYDRSLSDAESMSLTYDNDGADSVNLFRLSSDTIGYSVYDLPVTSKDDDAVSLVENPLLEDPFIEVDSVTNPAKHAPPHPPSLSLPFIYSQPATPGSVERGIQTDDHLLERGKPASLTSLLRGFEEEVDFRGIASEREEDLGLIAGEGLAINLDDINASSFLNAPKTKNPAGNNRSFSFQSDSLDGANNSVSMSQAPTPSIHNTAHTHTLYHSPSPTTEVVRRWSHTSTGSDSGRGSGGGSGGSGKVEGVLTLDKPSVRKMLLSEMSESELDDDEMVKVTPSSHTKTSAPLPPLPPHREVAVDGQGHRLHRLFPQSNDWDDVSDNDDNGNALTQSNKQPIPRPSTTHDTPPQRSAAKNRTTAMTSLDLPSTPTTTSNATSSIASNHSSITPVEHHLVQPNKETVPVTSTPLPPINSTSFGASSFPTVYVTPLKTLPASTSTDDTVVTHRSGSSATSRHSLGSAVSTTSSVVKRRGSGRSDEGVSAVVPEEVVEVVVEKKYRSYLQQLDEYVRARPDFYSPGYYYNVEKLLSVLPPPPHLVYGRGKSKATSVTLKDYRVFLKRFPQCLKLSSDQKSVELLSLTPLIFPTSNSSSNTPSSEVEACGHSDRTDVYSSFPTRASLFPAISQSMSNDSATSQASALFGAFHCVNNHYCNKRWHSTSALPNTSQPCPRCSTRVYPHLLRELRPDDKDYDDSDDNADHTTSNRRRGSKGSGSSAVKQTKRRSSGDEAVLALLSESGDIDRDRGSSVDEVGIDLKKSESVKREGVSSNNNSTNNSRRGSRSSGSGQVKSRDQSKERSISKDKDKNKVTDKERGRRALMEGYFDHPHDLQPPLTSTDNTPRDPETY